MTVPGPRRRPPRRTSAAAVPLGALLLLLGAWVFFVPLVGPYFDFGFFTDRTWMFSGQHWELLLGPGIALAAGGLLAAQPAPASAALGALLALAASVWLLVAPSLHPIWSGHVGIATDHVQWLRSMLWIGYFYGTGALGVYLSGSLHGLLTRRPTVADETVIHETPARPRERVTTVPE